MKLKAEAELTAAERMIAAATSPEAKEQAESVKAKVTARIDELKSQLVAGKSGLQPKLDAVIVAREAAAAADRTRVAATEAARRATHDLAPVSVFISRKTQRLYVRQAFQPILEIPITVRDADRPIGTHIFTAMERTGTLYDGAWCHWLADVPTVAETIQVAPYAKDTRGMSGQS
jgi:hypothetical protein